MSSTTENFAVLSVFVALYLAGLSACYHAGRYQSRLYRHPLATLSLSQRRHIERELELFALRKRQEFDRNQVDREPCKCPSVQEGDQTDDESANQCIVCLCHFHREFRFQCGHGHVCPECLHRIRSKGRIFCPECRTPVKHIIQIFR